MELPPSPAVSAAVARLASGAAGLAAGVVALISASVGAIAIAGTLLLIGLALVIDARRWVRLAARSRVGARSEDEVRQALAVLEAEGWQLRHSLPWRGQGDIDSVAIAPTGVAFAVETKTRTYEVAHRPRARAGDMAYRSTTGWVIGGHDQRWSDLDRRIRRAARPVDTDGHSRRKPGAQSRKTRDDGSPWGE
jgi:hypothetical protein